MSAAPALSVLVLSRDSQPHVAATLASLREQKHVAPEIVVVDRSAFDETRAWLETQRAQLAAVLTPAADTTTAAAINAGLAIARGEWVLVVDAGDRLVGDMVLSEALNWLRRTEAGVAAGEVAYDTGRIEKLRSNVNPLARDFLAPAATFYRRALFAENGDLDATLAAMARYELHVRLWKNRVRFKPIPLRIAAAAAPAPFPAPACREEIRVRHRYFAAWRCAYWDLVSLLRCALRR